MWSYYIIAVVLSMLCMLVFYTKSPVDVWIIHCRWVTPRTCRPHTISLYKKCRYKSLLMYSNNKKMIFNGISLLETKLAFVQGCQCDVEKKNVLFVDMNHAKLF